MELARTMSVGPRIACTSVGAAQAAAEFARNNSEATVTCNFFDVFLADSARRQQSEVENLQITCRADFVESQVDTVVLATKSSGEGELTREMLQTALQQLSPNGTVIAATDNARDHWLHVQLKSHFEKVTNRDMGRSGRLYVATRPTPLKKVKNYEHWFAFRDGERLIELVTRPGVFSHRRLDLGARSLIESLTVHEGEHAGEVVQPGFRVLDVGCGAGAVGLAAGFRAEGVQVHAMDASVRAIDCAARSAERNKLDGFTTQLEAAGQCEQPGTYDLVLANPPYYSHFRISEIFVQAALRAIKPGGHVHFVTKEPVWFTDRFVEVFDDVRVREIRGYFVVKAVGRDV